MRSNVLLVAGEHYSNRKSRFYNNLRETRDMNQRQRLRVTKNHMHKISRLYQENILTYTPGVTVLPKIETDRQSRKTAEICRAVWNHGKTVIDFQELREEFCQSFTDLGEVAAIGTFNPDAGPIKGQQMLVDEMGQPVLGEDGQPQLKPLHEGEIEIEEIHGFNLFRPVEAKTWRESHFIGRRKMVSIKDLKDKYGEKDPRVQKLSEDKEEFVIFDMSKGAFEKAKDQVIWKEIYIRPCEEYPEGYYYMWTRAGIFEEGDLPFGIFPIKIKTFDKYPTVPRGKASAIKIARPYQAEINRAGSSQAMAQLTLGDDKVLYQSGTKLSPGSMLPGVRGISFQGNPPIILPGRDGGQYTDYILKQIDEMYAAVLLEEENETEQKSGDPITLLLKSMRNRKKFAKYASRFERFLVEICELFLELAKAYYDEDKMIVAAGAHERVNIAEFKNSSPLSYRVTLEPIDDTAETKLGKHLTLTQALQYVGKQLKPEDIGKILREMPFVNFKEAFADLTLDQDYANNLMLALERGEKPDVQPYEPFEYLAKRLTNRTLESDFLYLSPEIQQAYRERILAYERMGAEQQRKLLAAKSEFIPTDGPMVKADVYLSDPKNPEKQPKRAVIPQRAIEWLIERLEAQGTSMERLEEFRQQSLVEMAEMLRAPKQLPAPSSAGMNAPQVQRGMQ